MSQSQSQELNQAVQNICQTRLTRSRPIRRAQLPQRESIQPSGPRAPNEGIDEQEQGIYHAEILANGSVAIYVTMLAAGFVIGTRGFSIRQICEVTKAYIRSETKSPGRFPRTTRLFEISGSAEACKQALDIVIAAVDLYKRLTEGEMEGQRVEQIQYAADIAFVYQPPPHRSVPQAAQLIQTGNDFFMQPQVGPSAGCTPPQSLARSRTTSLPPLLVNQGLSAAQLSSFDDALLSRMLATTSFVAQDQESSMLSIPQPSVSSLPYISRGSSYGEHIPYPGVSLPYAQDREILGMLSTNTRNNAPYMPATPWRYVSAPAVPPPLREDSGLSGEFGREGNNEDIENTLRNILDNLNLGSK
eukprot:TRINITY_DN4865_c0_g1_i10.p2 TRINITY_DN4865_c0_g1~~TRINITY_DN4865_c0_g1_i10.p2  ORF type:complete len:359 (-),score=59.01 TRINITY_DN4865_c0_g1_i10:3058-4134(-)